MKHCIRLCVVAALTWTRRAAAAPLSRVLAILLSAGLATHVAHSAQLNIGDPAPALEGIQWIKGSPVTEYKKGQIYLIDFWATWCGICINEMPHLSELQKKYDGRVIVAGINVENSRDPEIAGPGSAALGKFVTRQGDKMAFTVGLDNSGAAQAYKAWIVAAGQFGLPTVFLVDQQGKIAYIGSGWDKQARSINEVNVQRLLAGTFDRQAARGELAQASRQDREQEAEHTLLKPVLVPYKNKDYRATVAAADRIIAKDAGNEPKVFFYKIFALFMTDKEQALRYGQTKADDEAYRGIAEDLALHEGLPKEGYEFAINCIERTNAAIPPEKRAPLYYYRTALMADAYYHLGNPDKAIEILQGVLQATRNNAGVEPGTRQYWEKKLAAFRSGSTPEPT